MSKIEVRNVSKIFGPDPQSVLPLLNDGLSKEEILERTEHTVGLRKVSLRMEQGKTSVVMGLSGSGKSTLIRHLNRLIDPTEGEIIVDGQDVLALSEAELIKFRRQNMSMVFQRFGLFPHKTVLKNVAYGLLVQGAGKVQAMEKAEHWIKAVGLSGYEASYPSQLSGGMQQRVGLARALATDAEILLMDEAFSALDPLIRRDMQDQLIELQNELHKTIVFITHDLDEALRLGDSIAILKDGEVVQEGAPEEILLQPANDYVGDFVQDVNRGRVLTAGMIMEQEPEPVVTINCSREIATEVVSNAPERAVYLTAEDGKLAGIVTEEHVRAALSNGGLAALADKARTVVTARPGMAIDEVLPMTLEHRLPIAVVNEHSKLVGTLSRRAIIEALSGELGR